MSKNLCNKLKNLIDDHYDYSLINCENINTPVKIKCKIHNQLFEKTLKQHIYKKQKCPICNPAEPKLNHETFIQQCKEKWVNFDYTETKFKTKKDKIKVKCKIHNLIELQAGRFLDNGCPKCNLNQFTNESVILKFQEKYNNQFDYSKVKYISIHDKVQIRCIEHNYEFSITPANHLNGMGGCKWCAAKNKLGKPLQIEKWFNKVKEKWGDSFIWNSEYKGDKKYIEYECKKCNNKNKQVAKELYKKGCRFCKGIIYLKHTNESVQKLAKEIHADKNYEYLGDYISAHEKIGIICPIHGEFRQTIGAHIHCKQGCPKCGIENKTIPHKKTTEEYIKILKNKWNDLYDYANTKYNGRNKKITYYCNKCKKNIQQQAKLHLKSGCQFCNGRGITKHNKETYILLANSIHENKYEYHFHELNSMQDKIEIFCKKHNEIFLQRAGNHVHLRNGCPKCSFESTSSKEEKSILEFIKNYYKSNIIENDRDILKGKEIDIYIPDLKLGIEYHGLVYHTETIYGKKRHWDKANRANNAEIQLIQLYSWEWFNKQEIIKSKLLSLLGINKTIGARKTKIIELTHNSKKEFLNKNHMQGNDNSNIFLGLEYQNEIIACMTFGKCRFDKKYKWELLRYATKLNTNIIGGASKILKYFRDKNSGNILSYSDRRWSKGNLYKTLGFEFNGTTPPGFDYYHINTKTLKNRMNFQKHKIKKFENYDENLKEHEIMKLNGWDRIWNAGNDRWILN